MLEEPLPHYNDRKTPIDMLMFHCSALKGEDILQILDKSELSCHYIINEKANSSKWWKKTNALTTPALAFGMGLTQTLTLTLSALKSQI